MAATTCVDCGEPYPPLGPDPFEALEAGMPPPEGWEILDFGGDERRELIWTCRGCRSARAEERLMAAREVEVKANNAITNDPCAICGARCDPTGMDPFLAGSWALVCDGCAEDHGAGAELAERRAGAAAEGAPLAEVIPFPRRRGAS